MERAISADVKDALRRLLKAEASTVAARVTLLGYHAVKFCVEIGGPIF